MQPFAIDAEAAVGSGHFQWKTTFNEKTKIQWGKQLSMGDPEELLQLMQTQVVTLLPSYNENTFSK